MSDDARHELTPMERGVLAALRRLRARWKIQNSSDPFPHDEQLEFLKKHDDANRAHAVADMADLMKHVRGGS